MMATIPSCSVGEKALPNLSDAHRDYRSVLPVFPGAEGFGTDTRAGRGGRIFIVSNLNAEGPGSLKEALEAKGPRTVLFEVGGMIDLKRNTRISEPFLTVAGQSAPSPGITLYGAGLEISTHDVLVQHLRVRPGDREEGPPGQVRRGIAVLGKRGIVTEDVYNVVIDHCTLSWATDESATLYHSGIHDVTYRDN